MAILDASLHLWMQQEVSCFIFENSACFYYFSGAMMQHNIKHSSWT